MSAVDQALAAFESEGWVVAKREPVTVGGRSPNPTRVDLARGRQRLKLIVYAWKITGEGQGRRGTNYRIQSTRSHPGDLITEAGRYTIGFGIDEGRGVILAFDGWTKRLPSRSPSVHIKRATLDRARDDGYAEQQPVWDGRVATRLDTIDKVLDWVQQQRKRRTVGFEPDFLEVNGETATIGCDIHRSEPAMWLRPGDHLFLTTSDFHHLKNPSLWTVDEVSIVVTNPGETRPAHRAILKCTKYGAVNDPSRLLATMRGTTND